MNQEGGNGREHILIIGSWIHRPHPISTCLSPQICESPAEGGDRKTVGRKPLLQTVTFRGSLSEGPVASISVHLLGSWARAEDRL